MHGNKGKKRTLEQKSSVIWLERSKKISKKLTGRKLNKEHILNLISSHIGYKQTDKHKKNASRERTGKKHWNWKGGLSINKEHIRQKRKEWTKNNYSKKLWFNSQRRIKKIGNGGFHNLGEWENLKAQHNWTCLACKRKEPTIKLTEDHIIPLSRGGSDNIENIQPLCRSCNSSKYNKIIKY